MVTVVRTKSPLVNLDFLHIKLWLQGITSSTCAYLAAVQALAFKIPNAGSVGSFFLIDSIWMRAGVLAIPSLHHKCHHQLHMVWGYSKLHFLSGYFYWLAWCGLLVHIDLPLVGRPPKTLSLSTSVEPPIHWNQRKQKDITGWLG